MTTRQRSTKAVVKVKGPAKPSGKEVDRSSKERLEEAENRDNDSQRRNRPTTLGTLTKANANPFGMRRRNVGRVQKDYVWC